MHVCSSALFLFLVSGFTPGFLLSTVAAQGTMVPADAVPLFDGFVTAVTPQGIDVNGAHLRFTPDSLIQRHGEHTAELTHALPAVYLGQPAKVYGKYDKRAETVTVQQLTLTPPSPAQVSGIGIIDTVSGSGSTSSLVRADGRLLSIAPSARLVFVPPLTPATPFRTNLWIRYRGEQQVDGTVVVRDAEIRDNVVVASEDKLRKRNEYDPAAVAPDSHQSATSKFFRGLELDKIPPWPDKAMQERVERVGQKLIPAYQRALPENDPTKIHFRFQVIDEKHFKDAVTLPNGIIVVSHQVIDRLENDTQVATVLADNIATAIEKQTLRAIPAERKLSAAGIAGSAGGLLVPGLGIATGVADYKVATHLILMQEQQSGRVSLDYLNDAGFDVTLAPRTWWLLGTRPSHPLAEASLPPRAANLFAELGRSWRGLASSGLRRNAGISAVP